MSANVLKQFHLVLILGSFCIATTSTEVIAMSEEPLSLAPCPKSPNCVCSDEDKASQQYISPFVSAANSDDEDSAMGGNRLLVAIAAYLDAEPEFSITQKRENSLKVEARTRLLRFVDDIEMQVRGDKVYVRSASRVGYSDLGKNRKRLETVRWAMVQQGVAEPLM
jgi:uncharacterized protein (DUF1499 family)